MNRFIPYPDFIKFTEDQEIKFPHSVIIHFAPAIDLDRLYAFEEKLEKIIEENNLGIFDGHAVELNDRDAFLYMYGYNAETLFKAIKPELDKASFLKGGTAWLKFGSEKNAPEIDVAL